MVLKTMKTQVDPFISKDIPEGYTNPPKGGSLEGYTLCLKDACELKGYKTSFGNPVWREKKPAPTTTASWIQLFYDAGAKFVGFVHTDDFAYSIHGENYHYGATLNPIAPDSVPGGSSSGSASAIAMKLADIATGADTFGSVRIPASHQGIYGIKPTHNRIPDIVNPINPIALGYSVDTHGWFAKDAHLLELVGAVMMSKDPKAKVQPQKPFKKIYIPTDYYDYSDPEVSKMIKDIIAKKKDVLEKSYGKFEEIKLAEIEGLPPLSEFYEKVWKPIVGYEFWEIQGKFIEENKLESSEYIEKNWEISKNTTKEEYDEAQRLRVIMREGAQKKMGPDSVFILPASCRPPQKLGLKLDELWPINVRMTSYDVLANLAGFPQISLPGGFTSNGPVGLSVLSNRDNDERLLAFCTELTELYGIKNLEPQK